MKIIYALTLFVSLSFFSTSWVFAQDVEKDPDDSEKYNVAENFIENENFDRAIKMYKKLLEKAPEHSELNFKLGFCYLNTSLQKDKSIEYLENAVEYRSEDGNKKTDAPMEVYYYLGRAYRVNYMFEKARDVFNELKTDIPKDASRFHKRIDWELEMCNNVLSMVNDPVDIDITNLGENINSPYTDHSPVINADESVLIFTSRREEAKGGKSWDGEYFEDIFISRFKDSAWQKPSPISDNINTRDHEASIGLSADGQRLYIYKDDRGTGDIYVSSLRGDEWSEPVPLPEPINTKARETHASQTPDGSRLYFTSDRKGGKGGMDIYEVRRLPNDEWGKPLNLGDSINTGRDEEGPYISLDGRTLFFSSRGHNTIGGFDVFKSTYNPETAEWSKAENLGYPVNTTDNDVYYIPTPDGQGAYFVSQRDEGFGKADIYKMTLPAQDETKITVVSGYIWQCTGEMPDIKITVYDADNGQIYGIYRPNSKTGKYLYVLNRGKNYSVDYEAAGHQIHSEEFYIPDDAPYQQINRTIQIRTGKPCDDDTTNMPDHILPFLDDQGNFPIVYDGQVYDKKIEIKNILFPFGKATEIPPNKNLDDLAEYLNTYPEAVIEIGGYADSKGAAYYNKQLTEKRAEMARKYLAELGVDEEQIVTKGYGEADPIAINKNPDGTYNPEGQKYNRRIEFRVLEQGEEKLLVNPISNIPEELLIEDKQDEE